MIKVELGQVYIWVYRWVYSNHFFGKIGWVLIGFPWFSHLREQPKARDTCSDTSFGRQPAMATFGLLVIRCRAQGEHDVL